MSGTNTHSSFMLKAARAVASTRCSVMSTSEIITARNMRRDGHTVSDVNEALGWGMSLNGANLKLRRHGIIFTNKKAHLGRETTVRPGGSEKENSVVDARTYRPAARCGS